ncbi:unnamed protein product [Psylliodes chrysocephalus]|uniref:Lipocalin/cytosolic fatty-acid binding domain-containing protein n=1 Tax=Psylliodes chrysocephalus TaxID=3402493 RepID=A0A9P0CXM5_9CUCU|nr:unnamed protein product [Psylliodes chrysocephala]
MSLNEVLGKKYKLEKSENFDEYLKASGLTIQLRKELFNACPVMVLEKEGAQYVLSNTLFKNSVTKFTPGVEFDYTSLNGRPVKTTISINGNTLHEVQKDADGTKNCIDRTFKPNEVQVVTSVNGVNATRTYKLQA